jgi:hypothetical protein
MNEFVEDYLYYLFKGWTPVIVVAVFLLVLTLTGKSAHYFTGISYIILKFIAPILIAGLIPLFSKRFNEK